MSVEMWTLWVSGIVLGATAVNLIWVIVLWRLR
jgi:hypothetical protein